MRNPVMRNGCARACFIILCLTLAPLSFPRAETESKRPGLLFAGVQAGYCPDNIKAFSGSCTHKEQLLDVFVGVRLHRHVAVQTTFVYHDDFDVDCDESPPVPASGSYTVHALEAGPGIQKYPYYTSEIDVIAEPLPAQWVVSLRVLAGYGWIWTKDIPMWLAGAGFAAGDERVRFVLDIRKHWFEVPCESVTYHYEDGVLVDRHAVSQDKNERPFAIMAGLELGIPWLK